MVDTNYIHIIIFIIITAVAEIDVDENKTNGKHENIIIFATQNQPYHYQPYNKLQMNGRRFLTLHKKRRKKLATNSSSLLTTPALLDDAYNGQVQCLLNDVANWKFNVFTLDLLSGGKFFLQLI